MTLARGSVRAPKAGLGTCVLTAVRPGCTVWIASKLVIATMGRTVTISPACANVPLDLPARSAWTIVSQIGSGLIVLRHVPAKTMDNVIQQMANVSVWLDGRVRRVPCGHVPMGILVRIAIKCVAVRWRIPSCKKRTFYVRLRVTFIYNTILQVPPLDGKV